MKKIKIAIGSLLVATSQLVQAQPQAKPEDTEVWDPIPKVVTPGKMIANDPPSDAIILFDGKNLSKWTMADNKGAPAAWTVKDGLLTVNKSSGNIETRQSFSNYQLHIEWRIPAKISGEGQGRGNSGIFLASIGKGDAGYELQVLDAYQNKTYSNGMAGSIYKQHIPLANPARKPGEWQCYDVVWTAPVFNEDGSLSTPANVTVLFNGVLVQDHSVLQGPTQYIGKSSYSVKHGPSPIKLQAHGDKSEPISFRNIWIREL
jgi:hypothetical protein